MLDLLKQILVGASWLPLVLAFLILPYVYFGFAVEVHKEYADLVKSIISLDRDMDRAGADRLLKLADEQTANFDLEWWIIAAVAVLMLALFSLSSIFEASPLVHGACLAEKPSLQSSRCDSAKGLLLLYGVATAILIASRIAWNRVTAVRQLRYIQLEYVARKRKPAKRHFDRRQEQRFEKSP